MPDKKERYPWIKSIFSKRKKANPSEAVYAGPDMFNRASNDRPVYAGPEKRRPAGRPDDAEMNDVYAGPEFFEKCSEDEVFDAPEEVSEVKSFTPPPEFFTAEKCVYAGPEYFNPPRDGEARGVFVPQASENSGEDESDKKETAPAEGMRICPVCGGASPEKSKFCIECGSVFGQFPTA